MAKAGFWLALAPPHLRGWPGGPQGHISTARCNKKPFECALERHYSARVAGKLRARRSAKRYSHSAEIQFWGCSRGARFHAKARWCFGVLFRERFRYGGNLRRGDFTFRVKVAKTAVAWPKLGFGFWLALGPPTSAAGLGSPRGIPGYFGQIGPAPGGGRNLSDPGRARDRQDSHRRPKSRGIFSSFLR